MKANTNILTASEPIEAAVIGSLMANPDAITALVDLEPQHFTVLRALAELLWTEINDKGNTSVQMIASLAESRGIASKADVYEIAALAEPDQLIAHAHQVHEHWRRLRQIEVQRKALADLTAGVGVDDVLNEVAGVTEMLANKQDEKQTRTSRYTGYLDELQDVMEGKIPPAPSWPWVNITKRVGVMVTGRLCLVGARPGMGKTTATLQTALHASKQKPTLFISLEMPFKEILNKAIQSKTRMHRERISTGDISKDEFKQIQRATDEIFEHDLFIEDNKNELNQIRSIVRSYAKNQGVKVVIIDYVQLISTSNIRYVNENERITHISKTLKKIAVQEDVYIILISQLSRATETRGGDKRPLLSDLRSSGSLEQDGDIVVFLHRPKYYGITENSEGEPTEGLTEFIVAKHRHIPEGVGVSMLYHRASTDTLHSEPTDELPEAPQDNYSPVTPYDPNIKPGPRMNDDDIPF